MILIGSKTIFNFEVNIEVNFEVNIEVNFEVQNQNKPIEVENKSVQYFKFNRLENNF